MSVRPHVPPTGRTILVVDDELDTLASVRMLLTADSGAAALDMLAAGERAHVMLVDYFVLAVDGEELIDRIRTRDVLVQIVVQTGHAGEKPARDVLTRLAIQGHHDRSDGPDRLLLCIDVALKAYDRLAQLHIAERLKTELLASVSHEFRTPLNVIVGYIDLLREGTFGPCTGETLPVFDKLSSNAAYLLELVEEFLDLSKLEAGAMTVQCEPLAIAPFLRELGEWFTLLVRAKPIRFVIDVPDGLPAAVAEAAKLRVIVQNLLQNAAKFTGEGEIRLSASTLDDARIVIRVSDTGPGIAAEHHEAIFDIFHQLRPHDGQTKGIGLGLALARRFARMRGGDITVQSTIGAGSIFTVVLPAAGAPTAGAAAA
jgi:signal transduction histidine kinase